MPVQLNTEVRNTGFEGNYWRIEAMVLDRSLKAACTYRLYKSHAEFLAGKNSVHQLSFNYDGLNLSSPATDVGDALQNMQSQLDNAVIQPGAPLAGGVVV